MLNDIYVLIVTYELSLHVVANFTVPYKFSLVFIMCCWRLPRAHLVVRFHDVGAAASGISSPDNWACASFLLAFVPGL